jgi:hypothetical protein
MRYRIRQPRAGMTLGRAPRAETALNPEPNRGYRRLDIETGDILRSSAHFSGFGLPECSGRSGLELDPERAGASPDQAVRPDDRRASLAFATSALERPGEDDVRFSRAHRRLQRGGEPSQH